MNYDIIRPLGRGGMGEVYLARDPRLDRLVAIKTLRGDLAGSEFETQLRLEAQLLAQLNHPNIVQIYDITERQGQLALVMEYVDGHNLHVAHREGQASHGDILRWLSEIAAGLDRAHEAGIVHRDLKAENVLISRSGVAKVTDFGIAASAAGASDRAEDILALGQLAVQLLGDNATLSPTLRHLIESLLQRRAGKRPTAAEAAAAFRLAWHESTQDETQLPPEVPAAKPARIVGLALAVMLIPLLGGGWWWVSQPAAGVYLAILEPVVIEAGGMDRQQLLSLTTTVQQALQQAALEDDAVQLASANATAALSGSATELARALGTDEVVATSMRCSRSSCEVNFERIGADGRVISRRGTTLLAEAPLGSWNVVQGQWIRLFPGHRGPEDVSRLIDEEGYAQYLTLLDASQIQRGISDETILARSEELIERYDRFLPLYQLYTESALTLFDAQEQPRYLERAMRVLDTAATWAGDSPLLHIGRFHLALELGDFEEAEQELQRLQQLHADGATLAKLAGELESYRLDFPAAEAFFQQALALRVDRKTLYDAALNYYSWNKRDQAEQMLRRSLRLYPKDASAYNVLGMIQLQRGELDQGIASFKRVAEIEGEGDKLGNLGLAYMLKGQYQPAAEVFRTLYRSDNNDGLVLLNLADTESLLGNQETADALYQELIERSLNGSLVADSRDLSQAYAQLGLYTQAIATLKTVPASREGNAEQNFSAALVYTLAGQDIAALVEVEQALAVDYSPIWFTLPWFDRLCAQPPFDALLSNAGIVGHCNSRPDAIELR